MTTTTESSRRRRGRQSARPTATTSLPSIIINEPLSLEFALVTVFLTVTFINALLLSPINPLQCRYWKHTNTTTTTAAATNNNYCTPEQLWKMTWWAQSYAHLGVVLASLAATTNRQVVWEEQLMVVCCMGVLLCHLSTTGVFLWDAMDRALATTQMVVNTSLLTIFIMMLLLTTTTTTTEDHKRLSTTIIATSAVKDTSSDSSSSFSSSSRNKRKYRSAAVAIQLLICVTTVLQETVWEQPLLQYNVVQNGETTGSSDLGKMIAHATTSNYILVSCFLFVSVFLNNGSRQKAVLVGQAVISALKLLVLFYYPPQQGTMEATEVTSSMATLAVLAMTTASLGAILL